MATGTVKWFDNKKGYGFVVTEDSDEDIFVHFSSIKTKGYKTLRQGEKVEFDMVEGKGGKHQANNVIVIGIPEEGAE